LKGKLGDRVVVITGASSGIGVENARALYANGAVVYMPVRNTEKGKKVADDILSTETSTPGKLEVMQMDLDSLDSVTDFAKAFLKKESKLNLLINNAGESPKSSIGTIHEVIPFTCDTCAYARPILASQTTIHTVRRCRCRTCLASTMLNLLISTVG